MTKRRTLTFTETAKPRMDQKHDVAIIEANRERMHYGPTRHVLLETLSFASAPLTFRQIRDSKPDWMAYIGADDGQTRRVFRLLAVMGYIERFTFEGQTRPYYWVITDAGRELVEEWSRFNNGSESYAYDRRMAYVRRGRFVERRDLTSSRPGLRYRIDRLGRLAWTGAYGLE